MKNLALLLFLSFLLNGTTAQESSHCNVNPMLRQYYDLDVKNACLGWAFRCDSTYRTDSIAIPQMIEDSVWGALAAIFNVQNMPERDSVIDMYCVHQNPRNYLIQELFITVDRSYEWPENWFNGELITGIPIVDSIMQKYDFEIDRLFPSIDGVVFKTEQTFNIIPLCNILAMVDGILFTDPNFYFGSGPRFLYSSSGTNRILEFSIGWGDCMAGCIYRHKWRFQVDQNCDVTYLGTIKNWDEEHPIAEPWNCNISGLKENKNESELIIYPNPVNDILYLKGPCLESIDFQIINTTGQIILDGEVPYNMSINVSELDRGIYFIQLVGDDNYYRSTTIIKL